MDDFKTFYAEHRQRFFGYLMRLTGDEQLASDVLQESFTRYLERYGRHRRQPALLYAIGRNLVFDRARRRRREPPNPGPDEPADEGQEHRLLVREEYRRVLSALQRLAPEQRDLLALVVSRDLSYREIAAVTGLSEANVKVKVHRARIRLREILGSEEP